MTDNPLISYHWDKEQMEKLTKKELIQCCNDYLEELNRTLEELHNLKDYFNKIVVDNFLRKTEVLNDHIGSLQEKNELLHLDLAVQIHWRLKLQKELEELKYGCNR